MPGKLDEISEAIGQLRATVSEIKRSMEANRRVQEERHASNTRELRDLGRKLDEHAAAVDQAASRVAAIQPQVAALQIGRGKIAWLAGVGVLAILVVGRALEAGLSAGFNWLVQHVR